jgi:heptosyltransferase-2
MRCAALLKKCRPDVVVVLPHSFRSALIAWLSGAPRPGGYGRNGRGLLLTDALAPYRERRRIQPVYMAREYLGLVQALGCQDDGEGLQLHADTERVEDVRHLLTGAGPLVGIAPGAAFGPSKRWPVQRFARVAALLHECAGARCVVLTGPGEEELRRAFDNVPSVQNIRPDDETGSVSWLKAIVSQLDLLVCNDSGVRHIAVAFGVPVVCIMGPTSPCYTEGPYEKGHVIRADVDCAPCQDRVCKTDHRCMTRIEPEQVVAAALEYLTTRPHQ